ncbi:MAG: single-stranded DNA-binding protein [Anaeroplasmataceae bacterium]|nr:single-stranded DNA-binding protein [Anaeroplasmataceae bacterium]
MYNYFMLMGRVVKEPEIKEYGENKRVLTLRLAVSRSFKNMNGEVETDFFNITFWEFLVDYIKDNIKKGQPVLVKGRIQTTQEELANGFCLNVPTLIGERLLFFNNKSDIENDSASIKKDE